MVAEITDLLMGPLMRIDIDRIVADAIDDNGEVLIEANQQQLQEGQTAAGADIKPFYKPITVRIKRAKGQPTDVVTLKDEGGFYGGFYTKPVPGGTEMSSTDPKTAELVQKYGFRIFGLSVPSLEQVSELLRPVIQTNFQNALRT